MKCSLTYCVGLNPFIWREGCSYLFPDFNCHLSQHHHDLYCYALISESVLSVGILQWNRHLQLSSSVLLHISKALTMMKKIHTSWKYYSCQGGFQNICPRPQTALWKHYISTWLSRQYICQTANGKYLKNMKIQVCSNRTGVHLEGRTVIAIQLLHILLATERDFEE